jgi:hypothetical protein
MECNLIEEGAGGPREWEFIRRNLHNASMMGICRQDGLESVKKTQQVAPAGAAAPIQPRLQPVI